MENLENSLHLDCDAEEKKKETSADVIGLCDILKDILSEEREEKIGKFIEIEDEPESKTDTPWYDEEDLNLDQMYKVKDVKQIELDVKHMGLDIPRKEIIGDYVKIDKTATKDINIATNIELARCERLFASLEITEMQKNLKLNPVESANNQPELEFTCHKDDEPETPIIPDFEIDYDNIYEDMAKASEIEKQLQLLYRPFTCAVDVNCRFSLFELAILLDNTRYDPANHPALMMRLRNPSAEIKIYSGGKITSMALTAESARNALLKVIQMIEELDYKPDITNFSKNIVHASFCLPFKIDLELLSEMHSEQVSGNREVRPFVTYKIEATAMRFAVFPNGYVLLLHSRQHSETRAAIAAFLPILAQFKNGYLTPTEKYGSLCGDVTFKLLWEHKLEEDKEGILLYS
ncbi:TATA-box-binding protein isoform X2 [Drosophila albomicans]|uniref:TATA-box-binding protein isoform X2 n=1 Tax=Drosophila albomicans TaxID=7291 RepID=A0A6P8XMR7_DROAB|nr:TATA-box-binding protein isoform X2 [Drosophila albomicans]